MVRDILSYALALALLLVVLALFMPIAVYEFVTSD